jgi:hypothetical protein
VLPEQKAAVEALLERSGRSFVPIRRSFVQDRHRGGGPGPLAAFVTGRRRRALDLYLLLHALASRAPWDVELPGIVWARLLGLSGASVGSVVAQQWQWLEARRLIDVTRAGRHRRVVLLREDGSGRPYTHPGLPEGDRQAEGDYFRFPHAYWSADLQDWADLPTKAVILIALSLRDDFILPLDRGPQWYGISKDTLRSGLRGLQTRGFLSVRQRRKRAPLSATGYTYERLYRLRAPLRVSDGVSSPSQLGESTADAG